MSALSDLLATAVPPDWSVDRVHGELLKTGLTEVGRDTVWKYLTGRHPAARRDVLAAFADAFPSLRLRDLEAAGAIPADLGDWLPPTEANSLNAKEREAVETIIRSMAASKVRPVADLAAHRRSSEPKGSRAARKSPGPKGSSTAQSQDAAGEEEQRPGPEGGA